MALMAKPLRVVEHAGDTVRRGGPARRGRTVDEVVGGRESSGMGPGRSDRPARHDSERGVIRVGSKR